MSTADLLRLSSLYSRNAQLCKDALNHQVESLLKDGKSLSNSKTIFLDSKYQMWLSALYDVQYLLLDMGYGIDVNTIPQLRRERNELSLTIDERKRIISKVFDIEGDPNDIFFFDGCMMYKYEIRPFERKI